MTRGYGRDEIDPLTASTISAAAEVPDPRNSENKLISQIQNFFELAHNDCVNHELGT